MAIAKAAIVQHAHLVRSIVIARHGHRAASVIAQSDHHVVSAIVLFVRQDHEQAALHVAQAHVVHRAMAIVLSAAASTMKVHREQD
jgi:hypothetical protein